MSRFYEGPRALHRIDVVDGLFQKASGMLAPGKSYPLAMHPPDDGERREAHERWFQSGQAWFDAIERIVELEEELERKERDAGDAAEALAKLRAEGT